MRGKDLPSIQHYFMCIKDFQESCRILEITPTLLTAKIEVAYRIFEESNIQSFVGVWNQTVSDKNTTLFSIGLRTNLFRTSQEQ